VAFSFVGRRMLSSHRPKRDANNNIKTEQTHRQPGLAPVRRRSSETGGITGRKL